MNKPSICPEVVSKVAHPQPKPKTLHPEPDTALQVRARYNQDYLKRSIHGTVTPLAPHTSHLKPETRHPKSEILPTSQTLRPQYETLHQTTLLADGRVSI